MSCIAFLFCYFFIQTDFQWIIMDSQTKMPVAYVHVYNSDFSHTQVSDYQGIFSFQQTPDSNDTIIISSVGYQERRIIFRHLQKMDTILLQKSTTYLEPVTISDLSAEAIVKKAIDCIPDNYLNTYQLEGTLLTTLALDTAITWFEKIEVDISISNYLLGNKVIFNLHSHDKTINYLALLMDSLGLQQAIDYDHVQSQRGFLNPDNMDAWHYEMAGNLQNVREEIVVIRASHKMNGHRINHQAELYINLDDYAIVRCDFDYHWAKEPLTRFKKRNGTRFPYAWYGIFEYQQREQTYFLNEFQYQLKTLYFEKIQQEKIQSLHAEFNAQKKIINSALDTKK